MIKVYALIVLAGLFMNDARYTSRISFDTPEACYAWLASPEGKANRENFEAEIRDEDGGEGRDPSVVFYRCAPDDVAPQPAATPGPGNPGPHEAQPLDVEGAYDGLNDMFGGTHFGDQRK